MHLLKQIANQINEKAKHYEVGKLQIIRKEICGLTKLPSSKLFDQRTVFEHWGWHYGGRRELQFNIGIEGDYLRFGVAFSLECSQSLPSIDVLIPQIARFNEYINEFSEKYADLRMWHYHLERGSDGMPSAIPNELVRKGVFIFLGGKQKLVSIDYSIVLETLDRLLPLYLFTQNVNAARLNTVNSKGFQFKAGCSDKRSNTVASVVEKQLDISLRHNDLQLKLYNELRQIYGDDNVGTEIKVNNGSIDLVVKQGEDYWFYEIKTCSSAKACIRQALGQILEYSYWPNHEQAKKLVIVGEPVATIDEMNYIEFLRMEFNIPVEYLSIKE
ncbi:hypothetical protein NI389_18240 (plasmid) [Pseudoalteromonas xiamenensis]|uniref:hypothetical protein n=1 Tax=Pseudoalteromonas xiamenensis TaxID=882626 RepID=UPI0027E52B20|nr:hypothetical protein [Pseudoalteromonas xiamenensis]WMN61751.1 hypothetical protein NI389_18240 [Pseudoalteromonas xiamenensis]